MAIYVEYNLRVIDMLLGIYMTGNTPGGKITLKRITWSKIGRKQKGEVSTKQ